MVYFGWIHAYFGTDLGVCVCGGGVCMEVLPPPNKIRIIKLMDRMTAAPFMCQPRLRQPPVHDYRMCLGHKGGVIAASFLWSIFHFINTVISVFPPPRLIVYVQLQRTIAVTLCDTQYFGVGAYVMTKDSDFLFCSGTFGFALATWTWWHLALALAVQMLELTDLQRMLNDGADLYNLIDPTYQVSYGRGLIMRNYAKLCFYLFLFQMSRHPLISRNSCFILSPWSPLVCPDCA